MYNFHQEISVVKIQLLFFLIICITYNQDLMQKQLFSVKNLVFKQLLFQLNEQYENNTFQINSCVRHATETILQHKSDLHIQIKESEADQIRQQINLFAFALQKAPSIWAEMLRNDRISSRTTVISINTTETLTKVYNQIVKQTNKLINEKRDMVKITQTPQQLIHKSFDFAEEYTDENSRSIMAELLNNLANQIVKFYSKGKKMIQNEEKAVEQQIKHSEIMNPYFLFGILKQMSNLTYEKIEEDMAVHFKSLPTQTIKNFCRYVQKNYQQVQLNCVEAIPKIFTDKQLKQHINEQNKFWLDYIGSFQDNELELKKITSQKGDSAFMLINKKDLPTHTENKTKDKTKQKSEDSDDDENLESFNDAEKLIFRVGEDNQIFITNTKASQKKWEIFDIKDSVSGFYKILKAQLTDQASGKIQHQVITYGLPLGQYANFGGSVGKCLADINKYKSANAFLQDLSASTIIGGSMSYILSEVPILSYFVIAGGLTYTFYHTFNNKATSNKKKIKQFSKATVTAVGSVGSAVAGMMLGQTLIPIPFLGAFVGGVIGGFLGQTGSNLMNTLMNKESHKNLINFLRQDMEDDRYWPYSDKLLSKLGISEKFFRTEVCDGSTNKDNAYITAICFCVVSSYESKRYIKRNEQKMKQLEKTKLKKKSSELVAEQQRFDNQFNIVGIVDYLTQNEVYLLRDHNDLQKCIRHVATA